MNKDNDIDQLFKDGLNDPEIPFNEMNWEKMERKLDVQEKKRVIPMWVYTAGGIAAALVISLYFYSAPVTLDKQAIKVPVTEHVVKPGKEVAPVIGTDSSKIQLPADKIRLKPGVYAEKGLQTALAYTGEVKQVVPVLPFGTAVLNSGTTVINPGSVENVPVTMGINSGSIESVPVATNPVTTVPAGNMIAKSKQPVAIETDSAILVRKANALAHSKDPLERVNANEIARSVKNKMESTIQPKNDLILSAMAAPDMSFTKDSKPSKVSSNVGVLATYAFTSKISMTSGAVYSRKFYNSGGTTPQSSSYLPGSDWQVSADCNVLDIPLNVNYKIFNKKKLSVSLNTGLSSYFMLKEKYQFTTGQGDAQKVSNLELNNQNQHLFGIANVSVSFDHQITPAVSVGVQPFAKLPLTGIGYGDASLKSAGVSFSLNIGLFPAKKPGKYAAVRY